MISPVTLQCIRRQLEGTSREKLCHFASTLYDPEAMDRKTPEARFIEDAWDHMADLLREVERLRDVEFRMRGLEK